MRVTFWGVRGTFPAAGAAFARYGGDTMCVEVKCAGTRIILDAGSGLKGLGAKLAAETGPIETHLVLSHFHLDHIMGLPHFAPLWRSDAKVSVHAPAESAGKGAEAALFTVLRPPLFPLEPNDLPAAINVREFTAGDAFWPAPMVRVTTFALSHQGASAGIVIEADGRKLAYVTDHEHGEFAVDRRLASVVEGADLLIYDATFTDAEWLHRRGWGHSTWEQGLRFKQEASVALLALAHHEPDRDDSALDELSEAASAQCPNVFFARQGLSLEL